MAPRKKTKKKTPVLRPPPNRPRTAPLKLGEKPDVAHKSETPAAALKRLTGSWTADLGERLRKMPYQEFLRTPYWHAVVRVILSRQRGRCAVCDHTRDLHVHHKTYKHHGSEHAHLHDLVALCRECHAIFHKAGKVVT